MTPSIKTLIIRTLTIKTLTIKTHTKALSMTLVTTIKMQHLTK